VKKLAGVVLGLATLAACSTPTSGEPQPTDTGSQSTPESTEETTSEPEGPDYSLARLCELISGDEAQQLGGSEEGEEKNSTSDGHDICTWSDATHLVVGYQEGTSSAQADSGAGITNTPTTIDGLTAMQSSKTEPVTMCEVMVDLPSKRMFTSSATILSAGEGKYDACEVATELSNLIIPRVKDQ
jgi:hypothetical protein